MCGLGVSCSVCGSVGVVRFDVVKFVVFDFLGELASSNIQTMTNDDLTTNNDIPEEVILELLQDDMELDTDTDDQNTIGKPTPRRKRLQHEP